MKRSLLFFTGLFLTSASLNSMEITNTNFVFKPKERGFLGSLCYPKDNRLLVADFAATKDSKRTFTNHELLWAKRMNNAGIPQDITNYILQIRCYHTMNTNDPSVSPYAQHFTRVLTHPSSFPQNLTREDFRKNMLRLNESFYKNMLMLNKSQEKILSLLLPEKITKPLEIECASIQFSQEIAKQIDSMPPNIKKELSSFYGNSYYLNTSEPTFINTCLTSRKRLARIAGLAVGGTLAISGLYACSKIDNDDFKLGIGVGIAAGIEGIGIAAGIEGIGAEAVAIGASMGGAGAVTEGISAAIIGITIQDNESKNFGLGFMAAGGIILGSVIAGGCTDDYIQNKLTPSFDEEMAMRGFEKKFFLPQLEDKK